VTVGVAVTVAVTVAPGSGPTALKKHPVSDDATIAQPARPRNARAAGRPSSDGVARLDVAVTMRPWCRSGGFPTGPKVLPAVLPHPDPIDRLLRTLIAPTQRLTAAEVAGDELVDSG
jgi:hypothetical protein